MNSRGKSGVYLVLWGACGQCLWRRQTEGNESRSEESVGEYAGQVDIWQILGGKSDGFKRKICGSVDVQVLWWRYVVTF